MDFFFIIDIYLLCVFEIPAVVSESRRQIVLLHAKMTSAIISTKSTDLTEESHLTPNLSNKDVGIPGAIFNYMVVKYFM